MVRTARSNRPGRRVDLHAAIKDAAWTQIADHGGAAALSLRAIARELGITAPAIYNYYRRRDDLVTALVIDAFTSFGDAQLTARDTAPATDPAGRLTALGLAYRQWALANRPRYQLIFGAPVPGYEPPLEKVQPSGVRALSALVAVIEQARVAGRLRAGDLPEVTAGCEWAFDVWSAHGAAASPVSVSVALIIWARVHGLVSLEIGGHLPPFGETGDGLYRWEMAAIAHQFIEEGP
jgi:AcrR family transcriptional regulator